jgi:hypothetical protein
MDNSTFVNILIVIAVGFLVLIAILLIAAFFAFRHLQRFIAPDLNTMQRDFDALRRANANLTNEQLIQKIIQQQSFKAGLVGAVSGLGGFLTLPIALPVDILLSLRIQYVMVQFIAMVYNQRAISAEETSLQTTLVMSGGVKLTETTISLIMRGVVRLLGKSLSIVIPAIGAVVGFAVNYGLAQATGNVAMRFYAGRRKLTPTTV